MKVFISWSGNKSHQVGLVFREWLPSVIQSIEPYVSSEDIDKGARWSTDIAKELENSTFGILCVTKENLNAPWLSFEAGALSKTMDKSFVTPFLFDIKRSEVDGPILQFQSTIFEKNDIKKLVQTLNKACGDNGISESMLDKAFDVWYPTLEEELGKLFNVVDEESGRNEYNEAEVQASIIMEEILELSRDNQKLLRNSNIKVLESIEELKKQTDAMVSQKERGLAEKRMIWKKSIHVERDILHKILETCQKQHAFLIIINLFQNDFPWIYNIGKGLVDMLQSQASIKEKLKAISEFKYLLEIIYEYPMIREIYREKQEILIARSEMHTVILRDMLYRLLSDIEVEIESEKAS